MFEKVRFVWNITLRCGLRCKHCAAAASRDAPDDVLTKLRILCAIIVSRLPITIDFSGGDPWCGEGAKEVMQFASEVYGRECISLSSTGVSILQQPSSLLQTLASSYDLTYDRPWWYHDPDRKDYNRANLAALARLDSLGIEHNVTIPVWDMNQRYCEDLTSSLLPTRPDSILLLRLMPLGRNRQLIANDQQIADQLIASFRSHGYQGKIVKNCALARKCNGYSDTKLGLDQCGNIYWCIWAADLPVKKQQNPFYLGNLLEEPLTEILDRNRQQAENIPRDRCYVLDYYHQKELEHHCR